MANEEKRPLKVFLCHASGDKPPVRDLYKKLTAEGVDAWLDKEKLLPGQDWKREIPKAVQESDVVVVCLSKKSITKEGYVQKEIKFALDIAEEKPEGTIFLIPARLEECEVPSQLGSWQWVDLYEEDGFIKLLRSLKSRANAVGAIIEPISDEDTDKELERKLEQLYTEGLAAFYTEDWDRACRRFRTILSEQPNYRKAAEKLAEAECQRDLARLYAQATEAYQSENWQIAIGALEELSQMSADYKDTAQLLRDVRRQKQLRELYAEAKALHAGQKWQAVVKVFKQITIIEPNYPDAEGLLASAQKEVAELERLAKLDEQYNHALREMESGNWYGARGLLENVHKSQTGFLETEKLLRKVENEISREEEKRRQNDEINTLYEQAHGLLRAKKWRNALDKLEQIRKLDEGFPDTERIAEKAQKELESEEQEAERQNKLAAMYAEAVRLLKDEKYQETLDKWQEVKAIDPRYPDRQGVHRIVRKELAKLAKPISAKARFTMPKSLWIGLVGIAFVIILSFVVELFRNGENSPSLNSTAAPQRTNTPRPATLAYTASGDSDPTMYDDFATIPNGAYDKGLWVPRYGESETSLNDASIIKKDGKLSFTVRDTHQFRLAANKQRNIVIDEPFFLEAKLFLDPATTSEFSHLLMSMAAENKITGGGFAAICGVFGSNTSDKQDIECWSGFSGRREDPLHNLRNLPPKWHTIRIELYPKAKVRYIIDGTLLDEYIISQPDQFNNLTFEFQIGMNMMGPSATGYFDDVRLGAIEDDPN